MPSTSQSLFHRDEFTHVHNAEEATRVEAITGISSGYAIFDDITPAELDEGLFVLTRIYRKGTLTNAKPKFLVSELMYSAKTPLLSLRGKCVYVWVGKAESDSV